jgi:hypothetical protein
MVGGPAQHRSCTRYKVCQGTARHVDIYSTHTIIIIIIIILIIIIKHNNHRQDNVVGLTRAEVTIYIQDKKTAKGMTKF